MVNFYALYLRDDYKEHNATVSDVVAHINHIRLVLLYLYSILEY